MNNLLLEEQATNFATMQHIQTVNKYLNICIKELLKRGEAHDQSKLESPEVEGFTKITNKLANCTYGSEEYKNFLEQLKPILDHHYAKNDHHTEHFPNSIKDMNLIQILEMFCDWKAATLRH